MSERGTKLWAMLCWPNRISLLRLVLIAPFVILLINQNRWEGARYGALALLLVMALSDAVDGILARRMGAKTRLGAILDPLADKALVICAAVLLSLPETAVPGAKLPNWVVVFIVGKDLWVIVGFLVIFLATDHLRIRPSWAGKASTVGQLVMIISVLLAPDLNRLGEGTPVGSHLARAMAWCVAGLCFLAAVSYTREGLHFVVQEEKPLEPGAQSSVTTDEPDRGNPSGTPRRTHDRPGG